MSNREESTVWLGDSSEGRTYEKRAERGIGDALNRLGAGVKEVTDALQIERGDPFDELVDLTPTELAEYPMSELQRANLNGVITDEQSRAALKERGLNIEQDEE